MELVLFSLIDGPFVYIIVSHGDLDKSESFWLLNCLNVALDDFLLIDLVLELSPIPFRSDFSKLMTLDSRKRQLDPNRGGSSIGGVEKERWDGVLEINDGDAKDGCGDEIVGIENKYKHILSHLWKK
ncbi:hypothetical protein GOBAR_DD03305 [Gossypium barbadense]|nr:hypothetical protein GOBAR_DD03305 [Gossypium barbadense]